MQKKPFVFIILLPLFFLAACGNQAEASKNSDPAASSVLLPPETLFSGETVEESIVAPAESTAAPAETAAESTAVTTENLSSYYDNRSVIWNSNFVETDTTIYAVPYFGGPLMFWEKETGIGGPLCGRPDCLHNTDSCNAFLGSSIPKSSLSVYDGRIWWLGYAPGGGYETVGVWSMKLDGTDRRLSRPWNFYENGINNAYIYEGYLYAVHRKGEVKSNGSPGSHQTVRVIPIDGSEPYNIYDRVFEDCYYDITPCFYNGLAYFLFSKNAGTGEESTAEISCWDPKTSEWTEVLETTPVPLSVNKLWIEDDKLIIIQCGFRPDSLYQVKEGKLIPYEMAHSAEQYTMLILSRGIAIARRADEKEAGDRTVNKSYALIQNWDGTLLYEGELPTEFQNNIPEDWSFWAITAVFGDEKAFYIEFEWRRENKFITAMVRYDITPEGLQEQLMWISPEH